jgi:DNA-binding XRE family transcriptional regulator
MIYFVESNGLIKIGKTRCIKTSMRGQTSEPLILLKVVDGYSKEEKQLHEKFASLRKHGEWFSASEELLDYIESLSPTRTLAETKDTKIIHPSIQRILETMGRNIKLARLRRKITASLLAERAGIARPTLRSIERGDPGVTIGLYANVLFSLNLEKDIEEIALADTLGHHLRDAELLSEKDD